MVGAVLFLTVVLGVALAVLVNRPFRSRGIVRLLLISPFFIMPTVSALIWKNMMMNPIYGILAVVWRFFGLQPIDWLTEAPLMSIVIMVAWQWTPFAFLIFMTSLQSQDIEQIEAAKMDGTGFWPQFWYLTLPHLARPIAIVILIQSIFHLSVFAEIYVTTGGGPGYRSTNLTFLIFRQALQGFDFGVAAAGGVIAVVLANIVSFVLVRMIGKNLTV
jgi:sorbitol/mannitol transport system permease protein